MGLVIDLLPSQFNQCNLPQVLFLRELAADLWANPNVMALWLGGSFAHGVADAHSDVDLRVCVQPSVFSQTQMPAGTEQFAASLVVQTRRAFGEEAVLFHTMLASGDIYDLFVQPLTRDPSPEKRLVLACRDAAFAEKLAINSSETVHSFPTAEASTIQALLESFWLGQRKHVKVLARDLQIIPYLGDQLMRRMVIQLCFIRATGQDCGALELVSIHQTTPIERAIVAHFGTGVWHLLHTDFSLEHLQHLQDYVAVLGRDLASEWSFAYPLAAEETAQRIWQEYKRTQC
jgi:predicted nucleotidyltransferase